MRFPHRLRTPFAPAALLAVACLFVNRVESTEEKPREGEDAAAEKAAPASAVAKLEAAEKGIGGIEEKFKKLKEEFGAAKPERQAEIRKEAQGLQLEGQAYLAKLADNFPAAYKEDPQNPVVKKWSEDILGIFFQLNRYPDIVAHGTHLLEAGAEGERVGQFTGIALFAEHDFEKAAKVLKEAKEKKQTDRNGDKFLEEAEKYGALWKAEKAIREKEKSADDLPRVLMKTSRGDILIELLENEAPGTVGNFVSLVEKEFYNGIEFHRVIPGFMAQGGDPNTLDDVPFNDGQGGPGYNIPCECYREDTRQHFSGSLSMAHAGKDTGGSQFFLTHLPTGHLNGRHTVFGRTLEGLNVIRAIEKGDKILEIKVVRKRDHEYAPPGGDSAKDPDEDSSEDSGEDSKKEKEN